MKENIANKEILSAEEKEKRLADAVKSTEFVRAFLLDEGNEKSLFTVTKIAKDYGISAILLNKMLTEAHVQYRGGENRDVFVEQRFLDAGYAARRLYEFKHNTDGREDRHEWAKWTIEGRVFIFFVLRECYGLLPIAEKPNFFYNFYNEFNPKKNESHYF